MSLRHRASLSTLFVAAVVLLAAPASLACSPLEDATVEQALAIQAGHLGGIEQHMIDEYSRPIVSIVEQLTYAEAPGNERITRRSVAAVTRSWGGPPQSTEDQFTGGVPIDETDTCGSETGPPKGTYRYTVEFADGGSRQLIVPRADAGTVAASAENDLVRLAGSVRVHADANELLAAPALPAPSSPNTWLGPVLALAAALLAIGTVFGIARRR